MVPANYRYGYCLILKGFGKIDVNNRRRIRNKPYPAHGQERVFRVFIEVGREWGLFSGFERECCCCTVGEWGGAPLWKANGNRFRDENMDANRTEELQHPQDLKSKVRLK